MNGGSETVLLAVSGMSPAVITETVWALAHEAPPVIVDRVIVVTTLPGKAAIERELFDPAEQFGGRCVWDALRDSLEREGVRLGKRLRFGATGDDIRIMTAPIGAGARSAELSDLRNPSENAAAADFILEQVRSITENPDTVLVASIAGGRKTMGALLYASLSLLGRTKDRLTHVLVAEPFERPALTPRFYFPRRPSVEHRLRDHSGAVGSKHSSSDARPELADVPFVRLRNLFPRQIGRLPGRFNELVRRYSEQIEAMGGRPELSFDRERPTIRINGTSVEVSGREYAMCAFLAERCRSGAAPYAKQEHAVADLGAWLKVWGDRHALFSFQRNTAAEWQRIEDLDIRRVLSSLRQKLTKAGLGPMIGSLMPRRGSFGFSVIVKDW